MNYQNSESDATYNITSLQQTCQQDPSQPGCQRIRTYDNTSAYGDFSFGGSGESATISEGTALTDISAANPVLDDDDTSSSISDLKLGNSKSGNSNKKNFAAGAVKYSGNNAAGGGGGGGGGGASMPGGSGSGSSSGAGDTDKSVKVSSGSATYGASSARSAYLASARSKREKKNESSKNPFDSLFGAKGKGESNTDVQNYNNGIGNSSDSIFARISTRYDEMENQNRLTKYDSN